MRTYIYQKAKINYDYNRPLILMRKNMGFIHAEIELINGRDLQLVDLRQIDIDEVRRIRVNMLVDTGSIMTAINENIQECLQLPVVGSRRFELADGTVVSCPIVSPLEIRFKNRETTCRAVILPGNAEPLLGATELEVMDVLIDPSRQELIVHPDHPDGAQLRI